MKYRSHKPCHVERHAYTTCHLASGEMPAYEDHSQHTTTAPPGGVYHCITAAPTPPTQDRPRRPSRAPALRSYALCPSHHKKRCSLASVHTSRRRRLASHAHRRRRLAVGFSFGRAARIAAVDARAVPSERRLRRVGRVAQGGDALVLPDVGRRRRRRLHPLVTRRTPPLALAAARRGVDARARHVAAAAAARTVA
eukprot:3313804-Prymnesium_polylepis.1